MSAVDMIESNQYLTFKLEEAFYALSIHQVREVLDFTQITKVPRMPGFIRGVINLRGGVVPVVDLRLKFGMPETERTRTTCIIITEIDLGGEVTLLGILADAVQEVVTLSSEQIEPAPKIGTHLKTEFIRGMGKRGEALIIILETDRVFSEEEMACARSSVEGSEAICRPGGADGSAPRGMGRRHAERAGARARVGTQGDGRRIRPRHDG